MAIYSATPTLMSGNNGSLLWKGPMEFIFLYTLLEGKTLNLFWEGRWEILQVSVYWNTLIINRCVRLFLGFIINTFRVANFKFSLYVRYFIW